jgi:predicted nucleic acid-binding protein
VSGVVVVDASLAVKWLVREVHSDKVYALARSWARQKIDPMAPYLMPVEVANALYKRVIRKEISLQEATSLLNAFLSTGIELREPPSVHVKAMELAAELKQDAVYDAHYLALAEALNCELWTADERFYRAASSGYTQVRWIGSFTDG